MAMPDGVDALLTLAAAPRDRAAADVVQRRRLQSVRGGDSRPSCCEAFPAAQLTWETDRKRQAIVDSWPADVDDTAARRDWGFPPRYDFTRAFSEYLIPGIRARYAKSS